MREEYIDQFSHFWRTFQDIVKDFDDDSWTRSGHGLTTPVRTAYHIINSTKYYIHDASPILCASGKILAVKREELDDGSLPSKEDLLLMIESAAEAAERWLRNIDFEAENRDYKWTGRSMLSVVLFLLRHSQYHLGEMNALLNESKNGAAADHFAETL